MEPEYLPQLFRRPAASLQRSKSTRNNDPEPVTINVGNGHDRSWPEDDVDFPGGDTTGDGHTPHPDGTANPATDGERASELRNAELLNATYGEVLLWNTTRRKWMHWVGTHWTVDVEGFAEQCAKEIARGTFDRLVHARIDPKEAKQFAKRAEAAGGISAVLSLLKSEPGRSVKESALDTKPFLLNVANGTLDLQTGTLRDHRPDDLLSNCLSTPYDPAAEAPRWSAFVEQIMAGDTSMVDYLQRLAGSCLSGTSDLQELYIPYGSGANGKSVFFDTLAGLLESYASNAPESLLTSKGYNDHPTSVARLVGKRMVVASETGADATLRVSQMKRLTGDSTITARFMRQDNFEFRRTFKLIMITNNRPRIKENTDAVWRRLRLIPFDVVIPEAERDRGLLDALKAERTGILAWAVQGWQAFQANGLPHPPKIAAATNQYRDQMDEVPEFIRDYCQTGDPATHWTSRKHIYDAYLEFAESPDEPDVLNRGDLYSRLRQMPGIKDKAEKIEGKKVRGFSGLSLQVV